MRIGFIVAKNDDQIKKSSMKYFKSVPKKYKKGKSIEVDVAVPLYIKNKYDVQVDIIYPDDISEKRLLKNDVNFCIGFDLITASYEYSKKVYNISKKIFKNWKKYRVYPSWTLQNFIYQKGKYLEKLKNRGIPIAPTLVVKGGDFSQTKIRNILSRIKRKKWKSFIIKPEGGAWSDGIKKMDVQDIDSDPQKLIKYFKKYKFKNYIFQETLRGFAKYWEIRLFWYNGKFAYAIANKAPPATGGDEIISKRLPRKQVEICKKMAKKLFKLLPKVNYKGHNLPPVILRTDFGCCQGNSLDKNKYFLNEMEIQACNWFTSKTPFPVLEKVSETFFERAKLISSYRKKSTKRSSRRRSSRSRSSRRKSRRRSSRRRSSRRKSRRRSSRRRSSRRSSRRRCPKGCVKKF